MRKYIEPLRTREPGDDSGDVPALDLDDETTGAEGDLTRLVRRWMSTRGKGDGRIHLVPDQAVAADAQVGEPAQDVTEPLVWPEVRPEDRPEVRPEDRPEAEVIEAEVAVVEEVVVEQVVVEQAVEAPVSRTPGAPLPRRQTGPQPELTTRLAVLVDAQTTSSEAATDLMRVLAGRGTVSVCRAYANWSRPDLHEWATKLRHQGLQSFHHFDEDQEERTIVAMTIDAVDVAREAGVDVVVLAGQLESTLPLVHRLHVEGVRVIAVGPAHTPHDVRAACDEFLEFSAIAGFEGDHAGRHRA